MAGIRFPMWLLDTVEGRLQFHNEALSQIGGYAILSHCWEDEEVMFDEINLQSAQQKQGYERIKHACNLAYQHGHNYTWIDTCCIDKRSSAETSVFVDHCILTWMTWERGSNTLNWPSFGGKLEHVGYQSLLAPSPYGFRYANAIVSWSLPQSETFALTSRGLRLNLFVRPSDSKNDDQTFVMAVLNCRYEDQRMSNIAIPLHKRPAVHESLTPQPRRPVDGDMCDRWFGLYSTATRLSTVDATQARGEKSQLTLAREPFVWPPFEGRIHITRAQSLDIIETFPVDAWDAHLSLLSLTGSTQRDAKYGAVVFARPHHRFEQFVLTARLISVGEERARLVVGVCGRDKAKILRDLGVEGAGDLVPDVTSTFTRIFGFVVRVTGRYVRISGELFWSIHVEVR